MNKYELLRKLDQLDAGIRIALQNRDEKLLSQLRDDRREIENELLVLQQSAVCETT